MENRLSVRKSNTKQPKKQSFKKIVKPIKVVYISNPMKVKTSVSEFRSLVQELTGRDSDLSVAIDRTRFSDTTDELIDGFQTVPDDDQQNYMKVLSNNDIHHGLLQEVLGVDPYWNSSSDSTIFGPFDDIFVPQMVENLNGVLPNNTSLFYEAPHHHLVDFIQNHP